LDPAAFSGWWLVGGIVLLVAAVGLLTVPWLVKRLRRSVPVPLSTPPAPPTDRRAEALERIDQIETDWETGAVTDRAAAQALAATVKGFAGSDAATLTLLDLKFRGHRPDLVAVIEAAYPVEFGVRGEGDVSHLADRAREAVKS
jgi:hypothetical protein